MRLRRVAALASAVLAALVLLLPTRAPARPLGELYAAYWQDRLRLDPMLATQEGERRAFGDFDRSLGDDWRDDAVATLTGYRDELAGIDAASLSASDRRSVEILQAMVADDLNYFSGPLFETARQLPLDPFQGPHLTFAQDAAGAGAVPFNTVADYELALMRAQRFAAWADAAVARLREGVSHGVVLPDLMVERLLPQLQVHLQGTAQDSEFWQPIRALPATISAVDRDRLTAAFRQSITEVVQPAYRRLYDCLSGDYRRHARKTVGLGALPGGAALYRHLVRFHTTSDLSPEEIHDLGLREVERIEAEFDRVQARVGFQGSRAAFFEHARTNPALHFASPDEVIPAYRAAAQLIVPTLPRLFGALPRAPYEIRPLPEQSSATFQGNGHYSAPAADGTRPGILWMNVTAPGVQDRYNVMTISLHEGRPGHHFQAAIALEQTDLPAFRRSGNYTAYVEGWGLYAESLGVEVGLFDDPWQYFGHLNYAILRANRLVIDTGLHAYGWTIDDGVRWMVEHSAMSEAQARAEVERYAAYPAQALAYKVGELRIRELRHRAEASLGARFDVRRFHDRVLRGGPVPLTDLDTDIQRFMAEETRSAPQTAH